MNPGRPRAMGLWICFRPEMHSGKLILLRAAVILAVVAPACSARRPPPTAPSRGDATARLETADALIHAGCLDCLLAAFGTYRSLAGADTVGQRAAAGAIRAAALIDIRERELGLVTGDYLTAAEGAL